MPLLSSDAGAQVVPVAAVSEGYLGVFGTGVIQGPGFLDKDFFKGAAPAAILGSALAQHLALRDGAVRRRITVAGRTYQIRGVLPASFTLPSLPNTGDWLFIAASPDAVAARGSVSLVGELRRDVSPVDAAAEVGRALAGLGAPGRAARIRAEPMLGAVLGPVKAWMDALVMAAFLMLCLACAGTANLLLARGERRRVEIATRLALGASRRGVAAWLLFECVLLALVGCGMGLAAAPLGLGLVARFAFPAAELRVAYFQNAPATLDAGVLLWSLFLAVASAVAAGALPAVRAARLNPAQHLGSGAQGNFANRRSLLRRFDRHFLLGFQVAAAVCFACVAGVQLLGLAQRLQANLGFSPAGVHAVRLSARPPAAALSELLGRVRAVPGVRAAGIAGAPPFLGFSLGGPRQIGYRRTSGAWTTSKLGSLDDISGGLFEALGAPLLQGRSFDRRDTTTAPHVALVNQSLASTFWPGVSPIGKQLRLSPDDGEASGALVVGVVTDVAGAEGFADRAEPRIYLPYAQHPEINYYGVFFLVYRDAPRRPASTAAIAAAISDAAPGLVATHFLSIERAVEASYYLPRLRSMLASAFFVLALVIAVLGICAALVADISHRRQEIGLRLALGSAPLRLAVATAAGGIVAAAAGAVAGVLGAYWLSQLLQGTTRLSLPVTLAAYVAAAVLCWLAAVAAAVATCLPLTRQPPAALLLPE
jgi:predicted permease